MEHLISAAILRNGSCEAGHKSHAEIRSALGDEHPYTSNPSDVEGFLTSNNRFVSRREAVRVGIAAGQLPESFCRDVLSSDVNWGGHLRKSAAKRMSSARRGYHR